MQHQYLSHPLGPLSQQGQAMNHSTGPNSGGGGEVPWGAPFPSLHLWPIQDTFQMKMIHLPEGQRIKIGRQTNNKTVPGERNAYFDSKVLSRLHAEIWEQGGKIFIRDVRSSNGTFINGERLSPEGVESDPVEIKNEDQIDFGIDIVSDDNRTIVHHRVAAKAYCVFNEEDAARSARELATYQSHDSTRMRRMGGEMHPGANPLAQMGPTMMSGGGKAGSLSFEHVLSKLQAELHASKETGAELQNLATTFTGIQDTLSGGVSPSQNGSAEQYIPPQFRSATAEAQAALAGPHGQEAAAFIALQAQLTETQSSLSGHLDKIRYLETQLKELESLKAEVQLMREQMEESKREMDMVLAGYRGRQLGRRGELEGDDDEDDEDDARSVATLMDDEDSENRVRERRRAHRAKKTGKGEHERPPTPEPIQEGEINEEGQDKAVIDQTPKDLEAIPAHVNGGLTSREKEMLEQNNQLVSQINTLSTEISEALSLSQALQSQHAEAMSAIKLLTDRISSLESGMSTKISEEVSKAEEKWESWRVKFEESWKQEREGWERERERLKSVVREWEEASRRAYEEEEERQENERLSEAEYEDEDEVEDDERDEEEEDDGEMDGNEGLVEWNGSNDPLTMSSKGKLRRRRPSHKTVLAVRALKAVADGDTSLDTPKLNLAGGGPIVSGRVKKLKLKSKRLGELSRNGSNQTIKPPQPREGVDKQRGDEDENHSSESGRESGDTLKEKEVGKEIKREGMKRREPKVVQPQTVVGVVVVAIVVGAFWYKHKE
ncbi:hypothetical protein C350_05288 [Cryptococcus neoformans MW-RSA36]|nr:hypothetical protein C350_05288 [Cryptococcus neoformans var. grubii MW-RSA36]